jgi:hypothetical protein
METIIDNIILDNSRSLESSDGLITGETVLFSSLRPDDKPITPYEINILGIDYPQGFSPKCAICNSHLRNVLEYVYIDSGKNVNAVLNFFKKHYNAKLNWPQVNLHLKRHCDLNQITTPGLLDYEYRDEELSKWKYRELELALISTLAEINDVRGLSCKTPDEVLKRATVIDKLNNRLMLIKHQRDEASMGLPNVFEVLYELHEKMVSDEDKRIIREKNKQLKESLI